MAFDYGTKRIGIAVTDPLQIIATGLDTIHPNQIIEYLKKYLQTEMRRKAMADTYNGSNGSGGVVFTNVRADVSDEVGQGLPASLDHVLKLRHAGEESGLSGVHAFLKPLERAGERYGDVVGVLVDNLLDDFDVLLV